MSILSCALVSLVSAGSLGAAPAADLDRDRSVAVARGPDDGATGRGELTWFEGSWEELLAEAERTESIVFLDFWTSWCGYCKRLERETFTDDSVVAEMKDVLCYSIDAESLKGKPLASRFRVRGYPALIFLDPDGRRRDQLSGFMPAESFVKEVRRIKRNENTLSGPRKRIEEDPTDLEARYELALKLRSIGDHEGYRQQIAKIRELDPEGKSLTVRRMRMDEITAAVNRDLDLRPLYAFLESETDPVLLFSGWYLAWKCERLRVERASDPERRAEHLAAWVRTSRTFWKHVPEERIPTFGNNLAWAFYERRADLAPADLAFALSVAERAAELAPEDVSVIDTLACCQFAAGKTPEARATMQRCIELEPKNPKWRERLRSFGG